MFMRRCDQIVPGNSNRRRVFFSVRCAGTFDRVGLSLLEVLVALAVFSTGTVAVMHGIDAAQRIGNRTSFLRVAPARAAIAACGFDNRIPPFTKGKSGFFDDDPRWSWLIEDSPADVSGMVVRTTTVHFTSSTSVQTASFCALAASRVSGKSSAWDRRSLDRDGATQ
jgi:hypothetical protein